MTRVESCVVMEQEEYNRVYMFVQSGKYPSEFSKNQKDALRRKSKNYLLKESELYFRKKDVVVKVSNYKYCLYWHPLFIYRL